MAGAFLIYKNHKELDNHTAARRSLALGAFATAVLVIAAYSLPEAVRNQALLVGSMIGIYQWYRQDQETAFRDHLASGGKKQSWLLATSIGIIFLLGLLCIMFGLDTLYVEEYVEVQPAAGGYTAPRTGP
jgi:hypothetical protein